MKANTLSDTPFSAPAVHSGVASAHQKEILVPIDFSPESVAALRAAVTTAQQENAHLTLLNVVESRTVFRGIEVPGSNWQLQQLHARQMELLAETEIPSSVTADLVVCDGDPVSAINRIATQRHMDCILVGRHEHRGLRRLFRGRTAEKIAKTASCTVIVVTGEPAAAIAA